LSSINQDWCGKFFFLIYHF